MSQEYEDDPTRGVGEEDDEEPTRDDDDAEDEDEDDGAVEDPMRTHAQP
jgi:hypothetical protein